MIFFNLRSGGIQPRKPFESFWRSVEYVFKSRSPMVECHGRSHDSIGIVSVTGSHSSTCALIRWIKTCKFQIKLQPILCILGFQLVQGNSQAPNSEEFPSISEPSRPSQAHCYADSNPMLHAEHGASTRAKRKDRKRARMYLLSETTFFIFKS